MAVNLTGRNFLKLLDYTPEEITYLIDLSAKLKAEKKAHKNQKVLEGRNVALIFSKTTKTNRRHRLTNPKERQQRHRLQ